MAKKFPVPSEVPNDVSPNPTEVPASGTNTIVIKQKIASLGTTLDFNLGLPSSVEAMIEEMGAMVPYTHAVRSMRDQAKSWITEQGKKAESAEALINAFNTEFKTTALHARGSKSTSKKQAKELRDLIKSGTLTGEELETAKNQLFALLEVAL